MRKYLLFFLMLCLFSISSSAQKNSTPKKVSPAKLERKLKKDIQLVDVRTEKEFNEQHIGNAVNINVEDANFEQNLQVLNKSKPVYLYCRSGKRSDKAAKKLAATGFTKIYDLKGGITAWNEKKANKQ